MTEEQAKQHLVRMHDHFTAGSILLLLSDLHRGWASEAQQGDDPVASEQHTQVEAALNVLGLGVDAVIPSAS